MPAKPGSEPISIVGIGGTMRSGSSTEAALRRVLDAAAQLGARTQAFCAADIDLPMYQPGQSQRCAKTTALLAALRAADGLVIASPGYHGGVSGLVKNVLDYAEDLRGDARMYLDGRAVGCIGTGAGWQGAAAALTGLRAIVHALRGWNTPIGIVVNTAEPTMDAAGRWLDSKLDEQFVLMAEQIVGFARRDRAYVREQALAPR